MFNLSEEVSVLSASMVVSPLATRGGGGGGGQGYRGMEKDNFFLSVLFLVWLLFLLWMQLSLKK